MKSIFIIETEIKNIIALFDYQQLHYYTINSMLNSKKKYELLIQLISQIPNLIKRKPTISTYKLNYYYPLFKFIVLNLNKVIQELKSSKEVYNSYSEKTLVFSEQELKSSQEVYNSSLENTIIFPSQQLSKTKNLIFLPNENFNLNKLTPNYNKIIDKNQLDNCLEIYQKIINSELLNYLTNSMGIPEWIGNFPFYEPVSWEKLFPTLPPSGLNLIARMLDYRPTMRISAKEALEHSFFDDLPFKNGNSSDTNINQ